MKMWSDDDKAGGHTKKYLAENRAKKKRVCKKCGIEKGWIFSHKTGMNKRFKDETGGLWNGATCYACHKDTRKKRKYWKRNARPIKTAGGDE